MYENEPTQAFCFSCSEVLQLRIEGDHRFYACPSCGKRLE